MVRRRFLVMARVGESSLHRRWLEGPDRRFDLYLSYYGDQPGRYAADADYWREMKSTKWPAWHEHIAAERELVASYDAVWFPDDDLLMDTEGINRMFDLFMAFRFALAQPSLSYESHFSHPTVLRDPAYAVRFTNFVEVMAPIFDRETLAAVHPTFTLSRTGWGLDYLWPHLLEAKGQGGRIGIIDAVSMTHTRPVGGGDIYQGQAGVGQRDIEQLRGLYPSVDFNSRSQRAKFRIFGGARHVGPRSDLMAWLHGRLFRLFAKAAARRTPRYQR